MLCMFEYEWRRPYCQSWNQQTISFYSSSVAISKNSLRWSVCSPLKNITVYRKIISLWLEILFNPGSTRGFIWVTFDSPGCTHIDTYHSLLPISRTLFEFYLFTYIYSNKELKSHFALDLAKKQMSKTNMRLPRIRSPHRECCKERVRCS